MRVDVPPIFPTPVSNGGCEYERLSKRFHMSEVRKKCIDLKLCLQGILSSCMSVGIPPLGLVASLLRCVLCS